MKTGGETPRVLAFLMGFDGLLANRRLIPRLSSET